MMQRLDTLLTLCGATSLLIATAGCSGTANPNSEDGAEVGAVKEASGGVPEVRASDDCDPATFGALCNPNFDGETTLAQFQAELAARQSVGKWKYSSGVNTKSGRPVNVTSRAGETHTFTVVANFGGGFVPALNTASGNPTPAPECLANPNARNVTVLSGTSQLVTTGPGGTLPPGKYRVQCCIHPWMRTEIEVK